MSRLSVRAREPVPGRGRRALQLVVALAATAGVLALPAAEAAAQVPSSLELSTDSPVVIGTEATVVASVSDEAFEPIDGLTVRFEVYRDADVDGLFDPDAVAVAFDATNDDVDDDGDPVDEAAGEAFFDYEGPASEADDEVVACVDTDTDGCADVIDDAVEPDPDDTALSTASVRWSDPCPPLAVAFDDAGIVTGEAWIECGGSHANAVVGPITSVLSPSGGTMALLTSGDHRLAEIEQPDDPTDGCPPEEPYDPKSYCNGVDQSSGADLGTTVRGANDVSILRVDLDVPDGSSCLSLDVAFQSEEYPFYVDSAFNDGFVAELDANTWSVSGQTITAEDNFAFDPDGNVISVNGVFFGDRAVKETGNEYNGSTPVLRIQTPITPGAHALYLSIFDASDHDLDSAVFIDRLAVSDLPADQCQPGANEAPTAVDDELTLPEDGQGQLDVVGNDLEPDGDPRSVIADTDGQHGTVECTTAGVCTYTPDPDFFGQDAFTYTLSDGRGGTDVGTVSVVVSEVNDPPVAGDDEASVVQGGSVAVPVLANDVPGPANESGQILALQVTLVDAPDHGTVDCSGGASCTYTAAAGFEGQDTFTYEVCDDGTTAGAPDPRCDPAIVTVAVAASTRTLEVRKDGSGSGTVTSGGNEISCGPTCEAEIAAGDTVVLTAASDPGSTFVSWVGCDVEPTAGTCELTMNTNREVTATFDLLAPTTLDVTVVGGGSVTSDPIGIDCPAGACSADFADSAEVTLAAAAPAGTDFLGWDGACQGTDPTCIVTMDQDRSVTARFSLAACVSFPGFSSASTIRTLGSATIVNDLLRLTAANGNESGQAWLKHKVPVADGFVTDFRFRFTNADGSAPAGAGADGITFAIQNLGLEAVGGPGGGLGYDGVANSLVVEFDTFDNGPLFGDPNGNHVAVHTNATDVNTPSDTTLLGSAPLAVDLEDGEVHRAKIAYDQAGELRIYVDDLTSPVLVVPVDLDATLDLDLGAGWVGFTSATGAAVERHDVLDWTYCAQVPPVTHTLTVDLQGEGTGTVSIPAIGFECTADCTREFDEGTEVTLTATPGAGSAFGGFGGCDSTPAADTCVLTLGADRTVTATFGVAPPTTHALSVAKAGSGAGSVTSDPAGIDCGLDCEQTYAEGTTVTLTAVPNQGSRFGSWDGCDNADGPTCTVLIDANRTVTATFVKVFTLTVTKEGTGTGTVTSPTLAIDCGSTCEADFDEGAIVSLTATAEPGSTLAGWTGECDTVAGDTCTVSMTEARSVTATFDGPVDVTGVTELADPVGRFGRFEADVALSRTYEDPFDPAVVKVDVTFTAPSGEASTMPAFWFQDFEVRGTASFEVYDPVGVPTWRVRFAPAEVGTYTYVVHVTDGLGAAAESAEMTFEVTETDDQGFVRVDATDARFLRFDRGAPYVPLGHNAAFEDGNPALNGVGYYDALFADSFARQENWTRVWMTDFNRSALEWGAGHYSDLYDGVGAYSLPSAWRLDRILELAEDHRLLVQLVLNDHGQFSTRVDGRWQVRCDDPSDGCVPGEPGYDPGNPYSDAAGGPVAADHPERFFSDPEARALFQQRLRYVVARWGAYTEVLAWELFNEAQFIGSDVHNPFNDPATWSDVLAWHAEMAEYLATIDPYDHLVTTSSDPAPAGLTDLGGVSGIDVIQVHDYTPPPAERDASIAGFVGDLQAAHGKPVIVGEFGLGSGDPEAGFDPGTYGGTADDESHLLQGTHVHNAVWTGALSGSGSMSWWWGTYLAADPSRNRVMPDFPLAPHVFPAVAAYLEGEDWATLGLDRSGLTGSDGLVAFGLDNGTEAFAWVRDGDNTFGSGLGPGDLEGRTISGATLTIRGMTDGRYDVEIWDTYGDGGLLETLRADAAGGELIVSLPDLTRDLALKVRPSEDRGDVLILDTTVSGGLGSLEAREAIDLGLTVDVVDAETWTSMTSEDFDAYRAIVLGDPGCGSVGAVTAAEGNRAVWSAVVDGNVVLIGTDPAVHEVQGGAELTERGLAFAVAAEGTTGLYATLSCYYGGAPAGTPVPVLDDLSAADGFSVTGELGCYNDAHIVATHAALAGLTDDDLSGWSCSVHEGFDSWPAEFQPLAIAEGFGDVFTAPDGTVGTPYILARSEDLHLTVLKLEPATATNELGIEHVLTATATTDGTPIEGAAVTFEVTSGPHVGTTGHDTTGPTGVASFSYTGTAEGTDSIRANLVVSGQAVFSNTATKEWVRLETLTVTKAGNGTGTVTSDPEGIDCGTACQSDAAGFTFGTQVRLAAVADAGSEFVGWNGEGCAGAGDCVVTMDRARSVTATFRRIVGFSVDDLTVTEGNVGSTEHAVVVRLSEPLGAQATVRYAVVNGTATYLQDYRVKAPTPQTGTLTFTPGEVQKVLPILVFGDKKAEGDETFFVDLASPTGARIFDGRGIGTILNDDLPQLTVGNASVKEGNSGTTKMSFTVTLDAATNVPVGVSYRAVDDTATRPADYTLASGTLLLPPSPASQSVKIDAFVMGDLVPEPDERFFVELFDATNAEIATARGTGTIVNDDKLTVFVANDPVVTEGNPGDPGSRELVFPVNLSRAVPFEVTVQFTTGGGTATPGADYEAKAGTLTFAPNETSREVRVRVIDDLLREPNETVFLTLSSPTVATIGDGQGVGTIRTDGDVCTIVGTEGADLLVGTAGDDVICGLGANDDLRAMSGNDLVLAGTGNDTATGGDGNDSLYGEAGNDHLFGEAGADQLLGGTEGDLQLSGGQGADTIQGEGGSDIAFGDAGFDTVYGGDGDDTIHGDDGDAVFNDGDAGDVLVGDLGADTVLGEGGGDVIWGDLETSQTHTTGSADTIRAGPGDDVAYGTGGNDLIRGDADDDLLYGGAGNDDVAGSAGNDDVYGGAGNDLLNGNQDTDRLYGASGNDQLHGGPEGGNYLNGGPDFDICSAGPPPGDKRVNCEAFSLPGFSSAGPAAPVSSSAAVEPDEVTIHASSA